MFPAHPSQFACISIPLNPRLEASSRSLSGSVELMRQTPDCAGDRSLRDDRLLHPPRREFRRGLWLVDTLELGDQVNRQGRVRSPLSRQRFTTR
jgi:hypothetical protein